MLLFFHHIKNSILWVVIAICVGVIFLSIGFFCGKHWTQPPAWETKLLDIITSESKANSLDTNFVYAVIFTESRGAEHAVSNKGARGVMQLMLPTAKEIAQKLKIPFEANDLYRPEMNIKLGCYYLRQLWQRFGGDIVLVLAAYNTGPTRVAQWRKQNPNTCSLALIQKCGVTETKNFVARVIDKYSERKDNQ